MRTKLYLAVLLMASAGLAVLVSGCQDPYLTGANIVLNKPPDELTKDDYELVIRNLKSAVEQGYPQNFGRYYSMLARCYYYTGQFQLTRTSLDSSAKYWPDKADSLKELLNGYWGLEYNKAVEQMRRAAAVSKDSSKSFTDKAQANIKNAVELVPDKVENHIIQAKLLSFLGKNAEAKQLFEKAAKADPKNADVQYQIGRIAYENKDWAEAAQYLEKATGLKQDNHMWFFLLGETYLRQNEYAKAQAPLQKAANLKPEEKDAWYNLGLAYYNEGKDMKAAAQAFEKVIAIQSDDLAALEAIGICYLMNLKDYDSSIRVYKQAIDLRPDKVDYWTNLLYAYKQKGMKAEAKEAEKRIKQLQK
jgi:tetratricopeptide (TPR) repeat protein